MRNNHKIKARNDQKSFLQRICATATCSSVPLLYPDYCIFTSIFYYAIPEDGAGGGSIPTFLLTASTQLHGMASVSDHIQCRLTSVSNSTSTNLAYISYEYDSLSNLTLNHEDTRIVLNHGLTVDSNAANNIGVRCKHDASLFESIDSKQVVKNLCASQKYTKFDFFLRLHAIKPNILVLGF